MEIQSQLHTLILNHGLKWDEGFLRGGKKAIWIFDLREILLTPNGIRLAVSVLYEKLKDLDFDAIGGPSIAAEPLIPSLLLHFYQRDRSINGFIVRKERNNFGLRKKVEGPIKKGDRVVIIDDAMNSGESMSDAVAALTQEGCDIVKVITLVDFYRSGHTKFTTMDYTVDSVFSLEDFGLGVNRTYSHQNLKNVYKGKQPHKKDIIAKLNALSEEPIVTYVTEGSLVYVAYENGLLICFDESDYQKKWELSFSNSIDSLSVQDNTAHVLIGSGLLRSKLYFVSNGTIMYEEMLKGNVLIPKAYESGFIYGAGKKLKYIESHKEKWSYELESNLSHIFICDTVAVISTMDGFLHCFTNEGNMLWQKHIGSLSLQPLVWNQFLLFCTSNNLVFSLHLLHGTISWVFELKNELSDFIIFKDRLLIGGSQGYLIELDLSSGSLLRSLKISDKAIEELHIEKDVIVAELEDGTNCRI